jgi:asparagine synthase (glutamine-hydrolysing)
MCGICGYAGFTIDEQMLQRMTGTITHRGPDDEGFFTDEKVGLGMRRLSIIDVAGGHQPIFNEDRSLAIIFNGEIYNYNALADDLLRRGHQIQTHSDTETILHLYEEYGFDCVQYLRGMFAFAIYDIRQQSLFIVRDRLGIKPLYYWTQNGKLLFGSEIKTVLECERVPREPYLPAIDTYLSLRYVPGPETIFAGIYKLPAGHWLLWQNEQISIGRYWTPPLHSGPYKPDAYYQEYFVELFTESVRMRLMSEVPLGAYLSGGLDSSCIVATMAEFTSQPVKTFSVGFGWSGDELSEAQEVAQLLACDHHEIICRPEDMALLPKIVWHSDEPLGDAIVVPTFLLAQEASRTVKVVLTGEGADETLAGYLFHRIINLGHIYHQLMPTWVHTRLITPMVRQTPTGLLNRFFDYPAYLGEEGKRKVLTYLQNIRTDNASANYRFLISLFDAYDKEKFYTSAFQAALPAVALPHDNGQGDVAFLDRLLNLQYHDWLPDNILLRQDKMSMAHGLEARVPYLDHKLVEFLQTAPPHLKLHHLSQNKFLLRRYASAILPKHNAMRRKKPFYIPVERYYGHSTFRELVRLTLNPDQVRRRGYFRPEQIRTLTDSLDQKEFLRVKQVIALVILELWHMIFIDRTLQS